MKFEGLRVSADPLFNKCEILKFGDQITITNFLFAYDSLKGNLPIVLRDTVNLVNPLHCQISRNQSRGQVNIPGMRTVTGGSNTINSESVKGWNDWNG